jgi:hypothetical protein
MLAHQRKHEFGSYNEHCAGEKTIVCRIWRVHGAKPQIVTIACIQNLGFAAIVSGNVVTN